MKRTLIVGTAGFTGRYLARVLADRGHQVHGLVQQTPVDAIDGVQRLYQADITDLPALKRICTEVQPHHVVHLAAIAFVGHEDVEQMYRTNVIGTRKLLGALAALRTRPRSVILASSANVYGNSRGGALHESELPRPVNDYGVTKVAVEYVASLYREKIPLILVRPFNYTGRGQSEQFLIPKIIAHARRRDPEIELGNLDVARDFSDVRGVVEVYARLLDTPAAIGSTFNICSGRAVPLRELIKIIQALSGHRFTVRANPVLMRANEVKTLWGSAEKLERVIGCVGMPPLEDTLRWMLEA